MAPRFSSYQPDKAGGQAMYRRFTSLMLVATLLATVLLSNTVASAQEVATQLSGITVTGHGEASAPADSATLQLVAVSYTHLRAHETVLDLVCRLLLEK